MDADPANNIILTKTEQLTMNNRPADPTTARNKNVAVFGGSGSGKTRFVIKPNLLQCTSEEYPCSFVVTDPKGDIVVDVGNVLRKCGYQIRILNTINFKKSMHYNPFEYIHSEKDILKLSCLFSSGIALADFRPRFPCTKAAFPAFLYFLISLLICRRVIPSVIAARSLLPFSSTKRLMISYFSIINGLELDLISFRNG